MTRRDMFKAIGAMLLAPVVAKAAPKHGIRVIGRGWNGNALNPVRLLLQPVGEDWDGTYKPIDLLPYRQSIPLDLAQVERITEPVGRITPIRWYKDNRSSK